MNGSFSVKCAKKKTNKMRPSWTNEWINEWIIMSHHNSVVPSENNYNNLNAKLQLRENVAASRSRLAWIATAGTLCLFPWLNTIISLQIWLMIFNGFEWRQMLLATFWKWENSKYEINVPRFAVLEGVGKIQWEYSKLCIPSKWHFVCVNGNVRQNSRICRQPSNFISRKHSIS